MSSAFPAVCHTSNESPSASVVSVKASMAASRLPEFTVMLEPVIAVPFFRNSNVALAARLLSKRMYQLLIRTASFVQGLL